MAEKKSRDKTVKGSGRKESVAALLRRAAGIKKALDRAIAATGKPRLVASRAKKPMERVVREMPGAPREVSGASLRELFNRGDTVESPGSVPRGIIVLRPDQLDKIGLPEALVNAIRSDMERGRSVARKSMEAQQPAELGQRFDMSSDAADQMVNESDSPGLFINVCGCGGHVNLVISKPAIVPLKEGSENLVSAVQVDVRAIPGIISELRSIAEAKGVDCP